jgi:hypothetical protein
MFRRGDAAYPIRDTLRTALAIQALPEYPRK